VETLEGRQLMSATAPSLHGGILAVQGTDRADDLRVSMDPAGTGRLVVDVNGKQYKFARRVVREIRIDGRGGNDFIGADPTYGQVRVPMTLVGGGGRDTLVGGAARDSLDGGNGADVMLGRAGKDAIDGGKGADWLDGGGGKDVVTAGAGRDTVVQAAGKDKVIAPPRTTTILRTPQADPVAMPWNNTQPVVEATGGGSTNTSTDTNTGTGNDGGVTSVVTLPHVPSSDVIDQPPVTNTTDTSTNPTDNNTSTDSTTGGTANNPSGLDVDSPLTQPEPVPFYDATLYTGKPDLTQYGLKGTRLQDVAYFLTADKTAMIASKVQSEAAIAMTKGGYLIIDQESLPMDIRKYPVERVTASIQLMVQIVNLMHEAQPTLKVGYYGAVPMPDYWTPVLYYSYLQSNPTYAEQTWLPKFQAWQAANDMLKPIGDVVDFVCPSLYTFYDDPAAWAIYARANIEEAAQYGKPVIPFLRWTYHDSNPTIGSQPLPAADWKAEIDLVRASADGVIVWGGWLEQWDPNATWWQVVQDEIRQDAASTTPATSPVLA
jgi:hypothetical protein